MCTSHPRFGSPDALDGTRWSLVTLMGARLTPGTAITLIVADGRMTGSAGCNTFAARYESHPDGRLQLSKIMQTEMACTAPAGIMEQEQTYLRQLATVASYSIAGGVLDVSDAAGSPLLTFRTVDTFVPTGAPPVGWRLTTFVDGDVASSLLTDTHITLRFDSAMPGAGTGTTPISGTAGCNHYSAIVERDGEQVRVSPPVSTRMYCGTPVGVMEQEQRFLARLAAATILEMTNAELRLSTSAGRAIVFSPVDETSSAR